MVFNDHKRQVGSLTVNEHKNALSSLGAGTTISLMPVVIALPVDAAAGLFSTSG
jgi:hypothetical protein